jgi:hypothetical protein
MTELKKERKLGQVISDIFAFNSGNNYILLSKF